MNIIFGAQEQKKGINAQRRENKKRTDVLNKNAHKQEVKAVFNTVYKDQVAALYREVTKKK